VTRYFGGVKLGVGGLIRAYGSAVSDALEYVQTESVVSATLLSIHGGYQDIPIIQSIIHQFSLEKYRETYTENVQIALVVLPDMVEKVQRELQERSAGRISSTVCGNISKKV
jgi:putative IMPACT (imprinted ancient) family translation regulator